MLVLNLLLYRGRPSGGKVRHKRQALQDMARPLKQWLYKHRDNPYPTKTEKILLALGSQMTLVQVRRGLVRIQSVELSCFSHRLSSLIHYTAHSSKSINVENLMYSYSKVYF